MNLEKEEIAEKVKKSRQAKGLTQAALGEKTGLSLRSIQRIENGEVSPRAYSLNKLSEVLETSFRPEPAVKSKTETLNFASKLILSVGSILLIVLGSMALLSQSRTFPESDFELQVYWFVIILALTIIQLFIWKDRRKNV